LIAPSGEVLRPDRFHLGSTKADARMRFVVLILAVLGSTLANANPPRVVQEFKAKTVGVADGDSITVLRGTDQIRIRLEGVDAPESSQSFGNRAKQALAEMVFGKQVTIRKTGTDRYGRTLGIVVIGQSRRIGSSRHLWFDGHRSLSDYRHG